MRYAAVGGGKRLRGFFVLEGARKFAVSSRRRCGTRRRSSCIHAYSLIHDDLPCNGRRRPAPRAGPTRGPGRMTRPPPCLRATPCRPLCLRDLAHAVNTCSDGTLRAELVLKSGRRPPGARGMAGGQMNRRGWPGGPCDDLGGVGAKSSSGRKTGALIACAFELPSWCSPSRQGPVADGDAGLRPTGLWPTRSSTTCWTWRARPKWSARRWARTARPRARRYFRHPAGRRARRAVAPDPASPTRPSRTFGTVRPPGGGFLSGEAVDFVLERRDLILGRRSASFMSSHAPARHSSPRPADTRSFSILRAPPACR